MRKISMFLPLAALAVALPLLGGCTQQTSGSGSSVEAVRNPQGQLVDPKTGIPLPGQGGGAGAGGGY